MATERQKEAARRNIAKARQTQSARARGANVPKQSEGMSTAEKDRLADKEFAFPKERKEPLTDARHVRTRSPGSTRSRASVTPSGTRHGNASWPQRTLRRGGVRGQLAGSGKSGKDRKR